MLFVETDSGDSNQEPGQRGPVGPRFRLFGERCPRGRPRQEPGTRGRPLDPRSGSVDPECAYPRELAGSMRREGALARAHSAVALGAACRPPARDAGSASACRCRSMITATRSCRPASSASTRAVRLSSRTRSWADSPALPLKLVEADRGTVGA